MLRSNLLQSITQKDMVLTGYCGIFEWIVVADGHGDGKIICLLRSLDWNHILTLENPIKPINFFLSECVHSNNDGATLSIVKIFKNGAQCFWIGNSQIRLYCDNVELWRSANHDGNNNDECIKIAQKNITFKSAYKLSIIDDKQATSKKTRLLVFDNNMELSLTRCVGNNNKLNPQFQYTYIPFHSNSTNRRKIVVATDGFWDVMCEYDSDYISKQTTTAIDLVNFAYSKWIQAWVYVEHGSPDKSLSFISSSRDDIAVACWDNC